MKIKLNKIEYEVVKIWPKDDSTLSIYLTLKERPIRIDAPASVLNIKQLEALFATQDVEKLEKERAHHKQKLIEIDALLKGMK